MKPYGLKGKNKVFESRGDITNLSKKFARKMAKLAAKQQDIPPEIRKVIKERFWDMI